MRPPSRPSKRASGSNRSTTFCTRATRAGRSVCSKRCARGRGVGRSGAVRGDHAVHQHHPADEQVPFPGDRELERRIKSLVRWNALAMVVRANRESDGIGGHISTYASAATLYEVGVQPLLPRQGRRRRRRRDLLPGPRVARHLRARVSRRPPHRRAPAELPPRAAAGRRAFVVSASVADAGLLGIPDGLDGPRAAHGDLPGAVHPIPREPRPQAAVRSEGLGVPRRRRDGRARSARRRSRSRRARSSTT